MFNYGMTYKMYGRDNMMSPDDHYANLKRAISAIGGKARRITVIMPMLYEGRQHRRSSRESLDCAMALQELISEWTTSSPSTHTTQEFRTPYRITALKTFSPHIR